jgi:hypothetical protein
MPVFAFARIRVISSGQDTSVWSKDFDAHQRIVDLMKEGQGELAEAYVKGRWPDLHQPLMRTGRKSRQCPAG